MIGGGFPEMHADALAANVGLRTSIAAAVSGGAAVAAECAGLLFLAVSLDRQPMCGVLDARAAMTPRLSLGYAEAVAATGSVLFAEGARVHGHEFHRTVTGPAHGVDPAWRWRAFDGSTRTEGFVQGRVHASYLHLHWAGSPSVASRFVETRSRVAQWT